MLALEGLDEGRRIGHRPADAHPPLRIETRAGHQALGAGIVEHQVLEDPVDGQGELDRHLVGLKARRGDEVPTGGLPASDHPPVLASLAPPPDLGRDVRSDDVQGAATGMSAGTATAGDGRGHGPAGHRARGRRLGDASVVAREGELGGGSARTLEVHELDHLAMPPGPHHVHPPEGPDGITEALIIGGGGASEAAAGRCDLQLACDLPFAAWWPLARKALRAW
jgi:hypothetical protein